MRMPQRMRLGDNATRVEQPDVLVPTGGAMAPPGSTEHGGPLACGPPAVRRAEDGLAQAGGESTLFGCLYSYVRLLCLCSRCLNGPAFPARGRVRDLIRGGVRRAADGCTVQPTDWLAGHQHLREFDARGCCAGQHTFVRQIAWLPRLDPRGKRCYPVATG